MTAERNFLCYTIAVAAALATAVGAQLVSGIRGGDIARGFGGLIRRCREPASEV